MQSEFHLLTQSSGMKGVEFILVSHFVYMLLVGEKAQGFNRKIYTGYTHRLGQRIASHSGLIATKGARLTNKQPIELAYLEFYHSRRAALQRERQLKKQSPFNQKKNKIQLIKSFQEKFRNLIEPINLQLHQHYELVKNIGLSMNALEKELRLIRKEENKRT
ncbi:MAG: GIY-YIG nuclease family protein [Candidatus Thorarchaeota archaeon]